MTTPQKPLPVLIQEIKERHSTAREFYICKGNILDVCTDAHVYDNKPIWATNPIHVREQPDPKDFERVVRALEDAIVSLKWFDDNTKETAQDCLESVRAILAGEDN
jgi:hypothetical protein